MKRGLTFFVMICTFCTLFGCAPQPQPEAFPVLPVPEIAVSELPEESEPEPVKPPYDGTTNPLSGLSDLDPEAIGKRPVGVMINNMWIATPSSGINSADLFYEMLVEGGITRIEAVFADANKIPTIGSIRSARSCYAKLTERLGAIYLHIGGTPEALDLIKELGIQDIDGLTQNVYWRDPEKVKSRGSVHACYSDGEKIQEYIKKLELDTEQPEGFQPVFDFALPQKTVPAIDGDYISRIQVQYSGYITAAFEYDNETGLYNKEQFHAAHIDELDGSQIAVKNVIVLEADYVPIIDGKQLMVQWEKGGKYHYYCDGSLVEGEWKWNPENSGRPLLLLDENGEEIEVAAGRSWVSIIADFSSFEAVNASEQSEPQ